MKISRDNLGLYPDISIVLPEIDCFVKEPNFNQKIRISSKKSILSTSIEIDLKNLYINILGLIDRIVVT